MYFPLEEATEADSIDAFPGNSSPRLSHTLES